MENKYTTIQMQANKTAKYDVTHFKVRFFLVQFGVVVSQLTVSLICGTNRNDNDLVLTLSKMANYRFSSEDNNITLIEKINHAILPHLYM